MLKRILTPKQEDLLNTERHWLADLQVILAKLGATDDDMSTLKKSSLQLDELFLLVIVGEFNAGKSAFINALLGQTLLKEGVTPTTTQVNILKYGPDSQRHIAEPHLHLLSEPVDILKHINIVDTPGTNAVIREHQAITEDFVPRSDLVLFITSADRPFTESERQFLSQIKDWGKKVVIVINKIDLFETPADLTQVVDFVRDNGRMLLGAPPDIFPVSTRQALKAKKEDLPELLAASRFEPLERYIHDTLDETRRIQLKLLNPLGVGNRLLDKYLTVTHSRLELLADDFQMLDRLQTQLDYYRQDMERDFKLRLADIENILFEMERRGNDFFDDTMRLARVIDLINKSRTQQEFEQRVVGETPRLVDQKVNELIDWLVNSDLKQWQTVMKHLNDRRQEHEANLLGEVGTTFQYDREHLIDSVGRTAQRVIDSYDRVAEAKQIAENARLAVAASAMTEVGAIGLGAVITALATTAAADFTGLLAAGAVAAIGLFIIPHRKRAAKKELTQKLAALRSHLVSSLNTQSRKELERSLSRINDAVAPYTRFVRAERTKLEEARSDLTTARQAQGRLRAEIEAL